MSLPPQLPDGPVGTPKGTADVIADMKRDIARLQSQNAQGVLKLLGGGNVQLQYGNVSATVNAGQGTVTVNLPNAWPSNHLIFIATANPASTAAAGNYTQDSVVNNLSQGSIQIVTTSTQTWRIQWISLGN